MSTFEDRRCRGCGERLRGEPCERCGGETHHSALLLPTARGGMLEEYTRGLRFAFRGIGMTLRSKRLLGLIVLPLLINVALFFGLAWWLLDHVQVWLPTFENPFITGFDWLRAPIRAVVVGLSDILAILAALLTMLLTSTVVNAPFHEWISEAVESIVLGRPDPRPLTAGRMFTVFLWPLFQAIVLAAIQAVIAGILLLLSFSGVLAPVATVGSCWLLALSLVDVVIARKGASVRDRFSVVSDALPAYFGLATPLFFAPFLIAFFVPGATLLFLRSRKWNR